MSKYQFGSIVDRNFRNTLQRLADDATAQGIAIQDLVADGQLTEEQYSNLINTVNGLLKSGEVDKFDLTPELRAEVNKVKDKIDAGDVTENDVTGELKALINTIPNKINHGNVSVADIDKNKGKFDGTFFTSEFLEDLNNGEINTTNVLPESITNTELAPKSVSTDKTDFIDISTNMYNQNKDIKGVRVNRDTGELDDNELYIVSEFIPVDPEMIYHTAGVTGVAHYDENQELLYKEDSNADGFRINVRYWGSHYLRLEYLRTNELEKQLNAGETLLPYEPYYKVMKDISIEGLDFSDIELGDNNILYNVKDFAAKGDGITDDTVAIKNAVTFVKGNGGGQLYFPAGVYMISQTLVLPSNIIFVGAGMRNTVIKAVEGTVFDLYKPLNNIHEKNYHRTMVTFETSGDDGLNTLDNLTENVHFQDMTVDWNYSPVNHDQYSIAPVLVDRAKQITFSRFKVAHAIQEEDSRRLGSSIMFSFSNQCYMYNCELDKADYESLCVRFLSKDIRFINSTILDNFPYDKYTFTPAHYLQLARPTLASSELIRRFGDDKAGPLYVEDSYFEINSDIGSDLACVHYSRGFYFRGNTIKHNKVHSNGPTIIKPLDHAEDIEISGNYFDFTEWGEGEPVQAPKLINIPRTSDGNKNIKMNNNIVKINIPPSVRGFDDVQMIGINRGNNPIVEINHNFIHILSYPNTHFNIFAIMQGEMIGNKVLAENPHETITESGPRGIISWAGADGHDGERLNIKDNTFIAPGKLGVGLEMKNANTENGILDDNDFTDFVNGYKETTSTVHWIRKRDNLNVDI